MLPISVSVGDTLEPVPTHICERDPKELCRKFMEELERHGINIGQKMREEFFPKDSEFILKKRLIKIEEWCVHVPVLGFNSCRYDLNLIKGRFMERIVGATGNIVFLVSKKFRFMDIINYLTSYEKWVKA